MNLKEHLQFLAMMIPTFVLIGAAALSLAISSGHSEASAPATVVMQDSTAGAPAADDDR